MSDVERSRYRREGSVPCIDVAADSLERLLDNRDPSPFRDRDLHPSLVEYLTDCADDLLQEDGLRVCIWLRKAPAQGDDVGAAYRAHFEDALARLHRENAQRIRVGVTALLIAVVVIVGLFGLSEVLRPTVTGAVGTALIEGIVILGWVVLWRPADVLLFDWIPIRRRRRVVTKLLTADVVAQVGAPPRSTPAT